MKRIKYVSIVICIMAGILFLTGCKSKEAITAETFKSYMEENGFEVHDVTSQFDEEIANKVYVAQNDDYKIEFFEVSNVNYAKNSYKQNVDKFKNNSGNFSTSEVNIANYSKYTQTGQGMFSLVSKIENTFIYADVEKDFKDEINEYLKELGY